MAETNVTESAPTFGMVDLENAVKIIDAAASRGAFRGEELSSVGAVRDKLAGFIKAAIESQNAEPAPVETTDTTAEA